MRKDDVRCIFCYAYRPGHQRDGGFSVNVYSDDTLSFSTYDVKRHLQSEQRFVLARGTGLRIIECIEAADRWLWNFPPRMSAREEPEMISVIGLDSYPLFQLEDFEQLLQCTFRSTRGHFARLMYNLLEDISATLARCGFTLALDRFGWDPADPMIRPWQPEQPAEQPKRKRFFG